MGWEKGKGIGKDLQGRVKPVEAKVRKGKGAVGLYGAEGDKARYDDEEVEINENDVKKTARGKQQESQWRKQDVS